MELKVCSRCAEPKPEADWHPSQWRKSGRWCRDCMSAYYKARLADTPERNYDPRPCAWCGDVYIPRTRGRASSFCNRECKDQARKRRERDERLASKAANDRRCAHCGSSISADKRRDARYCSDLCNQRAHGRITTTKRRNRRIYMEVLMHSGCVCQLCGESVSLVVKWPHPMSPSIDHIVPVSHGGTDDLDNLRLTHLTCNVRRGAKAC